MEQKLTSLVNLPIISLTSGKQLAVVEDFLLNSETESLEGFVWEEKLIYWENVYSIGINAVIAECEKIENNLPENLEPHLFFPKEIIGTAVIADNGQTLGEVKDVLINPTNGRIESFEVSDGLLKDLVTGRRLIALDDIVTIGEEVIVIKAQ